MLVGQLFSYASTFTACLTHGDCQDAYSAEEAIKCFKIVTGTDVLGNISCQIRCFNVKRSYQCVKVDPLLVYGVCAKEKIEMPIFDIGNPDCSDAQEL